MRARTSLRRASPAALLAGLVLGCGGSAPVTPGPTATTAPPTVGTTPASATPTVGPTAALPSAPAGLSGGLLFTRFDEATHTATGIFSIAADGSGEIPIPMLGTEGAARWSTAGRQIAVLTKTTDGRIATAILDTTGKVVRVLEIPDATLNLACTIWSPDDARLACESWDDTDASRAGIYTIRSSDGADLKRLTTPPAGMSDLPGDWGTDAQVVFKRNSGGEAAGPLFFVAAAGGEPKPLTSTSYDDPGQFSPDGNLVATSSGGVVRVLDATGAIVSSIERPNTFLFGPTWSPDGKWLAYSLQKIGPFADLYVSKPDGSEMYQVTATPTNEIGVDWGPASG